MKQKWYQSWVVWTSIGALVAFILGNWGLYDAIGLTSESFQELFNLILTAMVAFGIINSPTNKDTL